MSKRPGKQFREYFQEDGEIAFRQLEIEIIKKLASQENLVIDCGGGVVLNKINIDRLRQNAIVVSLTASPETILKRTSSNGDGRPRSETKQRNRRHYIFAPPQKTLL